MTFIKLGALAIALASLTGGASAAVSGSANIDLTSFSYSIVDADLNDGITPTLSFSDDYVNYAAMPSFGGATSVIAQGSIPNGISDWRNPAASAQGQFRVSGAAFVFFHANYSLNTNVSNLAVYDDSYAYSRAQLAAGMHSSNPGGLGIDTQESFSPIGFHPSDSKSGTLAVSFTTVGAEFLPNNEDGYAYAYGFLNLNSDVVLDQATAAVPEPSEYLMLLAGLGVVGAAIRRSKR